MRPSRFLHEVPRDYLHPLKGAITVAKNQENSTSIEAALEVGACVFHPTFGIGRVEAIHPTTQGDMIKIYFTKEQACKTLLKDVAPLRIVKS